MPNFKNKNLTSSELLLGIFMIIVVAIIPIVTKLSIVPLRADEINTIRTGTGYNDVFSHGKSILIMAMGLISVLYLSFELFSNDNFHIEFKSFPVALIGIYGILLILSTLFTDHLSVALLGATERYEGGFVWLCYIVFFVVAICYSCKISRAKLLLGGFTLSGFLLGIIGLLQIFNVPIYENAFISKLIMGSNYNGNPLTIKYDSVFATLYNPNCAGMYFGMMASLFIVLAICLPKKNKFKYTSIVVALLTLASTIGSSSVGGFLGLACGLGVIIIVAVCYCIFVKKSKIAIISSIVAIIVAIVGLVVFLNSNSTTAQKIKIIYNSVTTGTMAESDNFYKNFEIKDNTGSIITADGTYTIIANYENSYLTHNGVTLTPIKSEPTSNNTGTIYTYKDGDITWDLYAYYATTEDGQKASIFSLSLVATDALGNEKYFMFGQESNGNVCFLDKFNNKIDLNEKIEKFGFEGIERLGSNRGYIWSRSIPLLAHNILWGSGADTFEFEFPQNDVVAKLNFLNDPYVILDKPHNMFLQIGIDTGVLSLIVLLVLFIGYCIQTIKSVFKDTNMFTIALKLGIMAGVIAYLGAGMTTDSVVSVAPVFWSLLGMGFGINMIGKKFLSKEERQLEKMRKKIK